MLSTVSYNYIVGLDLAFLINHYHVTVLQYIMLFYPFSLFLIDVLLVVGPKNNNIIKENKLRSQEDKSHKSKSKKKHNFLTKHCCCPFILSNWCYTLCLHNGCNIVPRNKKPRSQKQRKPIRRHNSQSQESQSHKSATKARLGKKQSLLIWF